MSLETVLARAPEALLLVRDRRCHWIRFVPARLGQLAGDQEQPNLLRGRPDRISESGRLRCIGGTRQTISSVRWKRHLETINQSDSWMIGKRGANPPLPRNCKRRGAACLPLEKIPGRQPAADESRVRRPVRLKTSEGEKNVPIYANSIF